MTKVKNFERRKREFSERIIRLLTSLVITPEAKVIRNQTAKSGLICFVGTACILLAATTSLIATTSPAEPGYTIPRHIRYRFTIQNKTDGVVEKAAFRTYAPVAQTATQQVKSLEVSCPYRMISDTAENRLVHCLFPQIPPYGTKIITIQADLLLSDRPNRLPLKNPQVYLDPEPYCECDDPAIIELAKKLTGRNSMETAEKTFRWVADNVRCAGYSRNSRGALAALRNRKGDCTEFMYLFVALCRANAVPARGLGGYVVRQDTVLNPNEYHNWAEVYADGCWHVADPQRKVFREKQSRYIAMKIIGEDSLNSGDDFERFECEGEGLTVRMEN